MFFAARIKVSSLFLTFRVILTAATTVLVAEMKAVDSMVLIVRKIGFDQGGVVRIVFSDEGDTGHLSFRNVL